MDDPLWTQTRQTGQLLQLAFSRLRDEFPVTSRSISGMARYLEVTKSTTQRLSEGLRAEDPLQAVRAFPGRQGLRQVVAAAHRKGHGGRRCDEANAAIDALDQLLSIHGNSKSRLLNQLDEVQRFQRPRQATLSERRALVQAAGAVLANHSDVRVSIRAIHRDPSDPARWTLRHLAVGHVGLRRGAGARPLIGSHRSSHDQAEILRAPPRLLPSFTTPGSGLETLQDKRSNQGDLDYRLRPGGRPGEPFDYIADLGGPIRVHHPAKGPQKQLLAGVYVDSPTNALIMDLFVERELSPGTVPRVDVLPGVSVVGRSLGQKNIDSWPHQLTPLALGQALQHPSSAHWDKLLHVEQQLFEDWSLNPEHFVGYRVETRYPIFSALYTLSLNLPPPTGRDD